MTTSTTAHLWPLDGTTTEFDVPFDYLSRSFVQVTLFGDTNEKLVLGTDFEFVTNTRIRTFIPYGPPAFQMLEVRRVTSATERIVEFHDASVLLASDLNVSDLQVLHVAEEARNATLDTISVDDDGNLDARARKIVNLAPPSGPLDAVNRGYVDGLMGGTSLKNDLASPNGATMIGFGQRTVDSKLKDTLSVKDSPCNAKGDNVADDTDAFIIGDTLAYWSGRALTIPSSVYKLTDGVQWKAEWIGEGTAGIGVFPLTDSKVLMVPGSKHKLPGSVLLFQGAGTKRHSMTYDTEFASPRYCLLKEGRVPGGPLCGGGSGFSVIIDFNYRDVEGGPITNPTNDSRAGYDVGILLYNADRFNAYNVEVGGYPHMSGWLHAGDDPDDVNLYGCRTMGAYGLGIIGGANNGTNSGLLWSGGVISANDHHSRYVGPGENWGKAAVYVNVATAGANVVRNGISFVGCAINTKNDTVLRFDSAGEVNFTSVKFENAAQAGSSQAGAANKKFDITANTGELNFTSCRLNYNPFSLMLDNAGPSLGVVATGCVRGLPLIVISGGKAMTFAGTQANSNLTFTDDLKTSTKGITLNAAWVARQLNFRVDNTTVFSVNSNGVVDMHTLPSTLTPSGGTASRARRFHRLTLPAGQVLSTLNGGTDGEEVTLIQNTSTDVGVVKDLVGNLRLAGDFTLAPFRTITLIKYGDFWLEKSRSNR